MRDTGDDTVFEVSGRGELHLTILLETMRREGYELAVSRPRVVFKEIDGVKCEPFESLTIDVEDAHQGGVMEELGRRKGDLQDMQPDGRGRTRLEYLIPARGLIGFQNEFLTLTRGTGLMSHIFHEYAPIKEGSIGERRNGVLISQDNGDAVAYALWKLQDRGRMFVNPGEALYEGMIIGIHSRDNDLVVNPIKGKQLTNVRASGTDEAVRLVPPIQMSLEYAVEFIDDDELVELTPVDPPAQALPARARAQARRPRIGGVAWRGPGPRCASRVGRGRENAPDRSRGIFFGRTICSQTGSGARASAVLMPVFLRPAAIPIRRGARIDHVYIRALVQLAQDAPEGIVDILDVARLLRLGVGLVGDADVQVEGVPAQFGQRLPADEPLFMRDVLQRDGDDRQLLAQHGLRQAGDGFDDAAADGGIGLAGQVDDDVGHGRLLQVEDRIGKAGWLEPV